MSLVTRCPHCATAFKVVADQLRVRNGLVRCGVCNTVFDGRACLVTPGEPDPATRAPLPVVEQAVPMPPTPAAVPGPAAEPVPAPAVLRGRQAMRQAGPADDEGQDGDQDDDAPDPASARHEDGDFHAGRDEAPWDDARAWTVGDGDSWRGGPREPGLAAEPGLADAPMPDEGEGLAFPGERRTRYSSATDSGRTPPEFLDDDRARARGLGRRLWALACLAALLALGLQLVYVYRSSIATNVPMLRPVLALACKPLDCSVGYVRRLERIAITSSSLRTPQGAAASAAEGRSPMVLNVVMRNRFDKPQPWPALVLELTDISDTVVARKVLMPQDYLDSARASGPFGAGAEVSLAVPVEVQGINVNGYQLDKFFP
ncbi:DUF3426 domain-containing protein [Bordetella hinzii]|uniref:DUF3426 domain-containing protein n=1 Tax=Bordetella hinzii TaxID=103855 RepID=UPI00114F6F00|nr:DUF3426 domain-containing protein [Bordetella hinzii]QDJ50782.1 hypothetical protein CBR69_10865 [Bordetella hinzii]